MATSVALIDPAQAAVVEAVQRELLDVVESLERHGGIYARDYIIAALEAPRGRRLASRTPRTPAGLAPVAARCVKEIALDHLTYARWDGPDRRRSGERRDGPVGR